MYGMATSQGVGQCTPVGLHVVDAHVGCLIEIQLEPV